MSKCKKILLSFCLTALLLCSVLPLSAFASEVSMKFDCPEPSYSDNSGYIAFKISDTWGLTFVFNCIPLQNVIELNDVLDISVTILGTNYVSSSNLTQLNYVIMSNSKVDFMVSTHVIDNSGNVRYDPITLCEGTSFFGTIAWEGRNPIQAMSFKGNVFVDGEGQGLNSGRIPALTPVWSGSDSYYSNFDEIIEWLSWLYDSDIAILNDFVTLFNKMDTLHTDNTELLNRFSSLLLHVVKVSEDLDFVLEDLYSLLIVQNSIEDLCHLFVNYLYDSLDWHMFEIQYYLMDVNDKLDYLIDLLQPDTEVNVSKVDTSNLDNYLDAENSLLNNDNVDVSNAVKVEIDQQAMVIIWDKLQAIVNSNPKVFGLIITVLSISVVALILGRGK